MKIKRCDHCLNTIENCFCNPFLVSPDSTVWIITSTCPEDGTSQIEGVYHSEAKAKQMLKKFEEDEYESGNFEIQEWKVL